MIRIPVFAIVVAGLLIVLAILFATAALPEPNRAEWFRSLKQPQTGMSCCDISDCRSTDWELRGTEFWVPLNGQWVPVPADKILDRPSIDGDAYLCSGTANIYCFVRPTLGF